ncbi:MAG: 2-dehydropantoate 2-reductase, partial [Proteobacteria bacterium]|nr:2-dehydropantoate 2-reductase [Pseudomonadota bacterium]
MSEVVANPEQREELEAAMVEAAAVASAYDVGLPDDIVERQMKVAEGFPAGQKASMAYDLDMGKPLELPWLSGAVARLGRARDVATPVSDAITGALKPWVNGTPLP